MERKEIEGNYPQVVVMDSKRGLVSIKKPDSSEEPKEFTFDAVYDWKYELYSLLTLFFIFIIINIQIIIIWTSKAPNKEICTKKHFIPLLNRF